MKTRTYLYLVLMAAGQVAAHAQSFYVASYGSNANPCTLTAPCASFNAAISLAPAGGIVTALDSGGYGGFTVTKALTIDGGQHGAIINVDPFSTVGIQMIPDPGATGTVTLRNLEIAFTGQATGSTHTGIVGSLQGLSFTADHVSISTANLGLGATYEGIRLIGGSSSVLSVKDVTISGVQNGIFLSGPGSTNATLENVSVSASTTGFAASTINTTVRNSSFVSSSPQATGIALFSGTLSPVAMIENTQIANQGTGLSITGGTVRLSNCVISGNTLGVAASAGATIISYRNNTFGGNGADGAISLSSSLK